MCIVESLEDPASDEADECVIPVVNVLENAEFPGLVTYLFEGTVREARDRLIKTPRLLSDRHHGVSGNSPTQEDTSTCPISNYIKI